MTITRVVTHADPADPRTGEAALALAAGLGAELEAVVFAAEVMAGGPEPDEPAALRRLNERAAARGVSCLAHGRRSQAEGIGSELAARLRVADLGVLDWPGPVTAARRLMAAGMVFHGAGPVILAPPGTLSGVPSRVVLGWDDSAAAARALRAAMPLLRQAELVSVAVVAEAGEDAPSADGAVEALKRHGIPALAHPVRRDGRAILACLREAARERGAGLVVAGAARHAPVHDMLFGSLTHDVMAGQAGMAVLLAA